jgi:cysteine sulfinate desulfinase/cysteine desulfurase-like protein
VLLAMNVPIDLAIGSVRMSAWPAHTEAEIDRVVEALPAVVARLRAAGVPAI